jgi:opacity protein-like surface antigen
MYKISKLAVGSVIAASAALGGASVALADGYVPRGKVVYERPSDWSGVYFGVSSGYQWSSIDVANPAGGGAVGTAITSDHADGLAGAHLGVQHQFATIVLGVEAGWYASLRSHDGDSQACWNPAPVLVVGGALTGSCTAQFNDAITVGGRLGWAAGHWMPYITGGYANGGFDFNGRIPGAAPTATTLTETAHTRLNGWYIGGGAEWKISPGWTAGIEYRHYEFEDRDTTAYNPATGLARETVRFDAGTDTVTARVSWRWGREVAAPLK